MEGVAMFLIQTTDIHEDNGAVALFAEDFHFASLWQFEPDAQDAEEEYDSDGVFETVEAPAPNF
jgi:hypothetical protein